MSLPRIVFHVQDPETHPIASARLDATSVHGPWSGVTNTAGDFEAFLSPGHYDVVVTATGFASRAVPADLADPGTINIGLARQNSALTVRGQWFEWHGVRTPLVGTDAFLDFRLFRDGADLTPFFVEARDLGVNTRRVFFMGAKSENQVMDLSPREPGFYDDVRRYVDLANHHGFAVLATIGVDNQVVNMGLDHWAKMADLLRGSTTIFSCFNEWSKNHGSIDPGAIADPRMLWSRGSDVGDAAPFRPEGSVLEFHPVRNYATAMRDAVASPIQLFEVDGYHAPLIIDEPGRLGTNAHDARFANAQTCESYGRALSALCAGAVAHNWFGQRGLLMDGLTRDCVAAFAKGFVR